MPSAAGSGAPYVGGMETTEYEAPTIAEIGTLHELTLQGKQFGATDGFTFQGQSITNT